MCLFSDESADDELPFPPKHESALKGLTRVQIQARSSKKAKENLDAAKEREAKANRVGLVATSTCIRTACGSVR